MKNIISKIKKVFNIMFNGVKEKKVNTNPDEIDEWLCNSESKRLYDEEDLKVFFRDFNIKLVMGEVNLTPDINRLSKKTIRKCRKLSKKGMIIGGSVLLKCYGILDRDIDDIDVFWDINKALNSGIINKKNIINDSNNPYFDDLETIRYKIRMKWFGIVDIFDIGTDDIPHTVISGINFKSPMGTLEAKLNYFREKDHEDLMYIKNKFNI